MRGIFAGTGAILAPLSIDGSAIALLAPSMIHHKGAARPVHGMGGLVAALERCLTAHGGTAQLSSEVVSVGMNARGGTVELLDGTVIRASRAVIAACPVQRVPDLVGDALPAELSARIRKAPANSTGLGTFTINAALSGRIELPNHQPNRTDGVDLRKPALYMGTLDEVVAAGEPSARGNFRTRRRFASAFSLRLTRAKRPRVRTWSAYSPAPVDPVGGWDKWRGEAERRLEDKVTEAAPEFKRLQIGTFVETAQDLAARERVQRTGASITSTTCRRGLDPFDLQSERGATGHR